MRYPFPRDPAGPPVFAVFDPADPDAAWIAEDLGTDAVELESAEAFGCPAHPRLRVRAAALTPRQLRALCVRLGGHYPGISRAGAFWEVVQGGGLSVLARGCYVCDDPAVGRDYFAGLARLRSKKGGGR